MITLTLHYRVKLRASTDTCTYKKEVRLPAIPGVGTTIHIEPTKVQVTRVLMKDGEEFILIILEDKWFNTRYLFERYVKHLEDHGWERVARRQESQKMSKDKPNKPSSSQLRETGNFTSSRKYNIHGLQLHVVEETAAQKRERAEREAKQATCPHPNLTYEAGKLITLRDRDTLEITGSASATITCDDCKKTVGYRQDVKGDIFNETVAATEVKPDPFEKIARAMFSTPEPLFKKGGDGD